MAAVTYLSYTDATIDTCGTTAGTTLNYYVVTDTTNGQTATGVVTTRNSADGTTDLPCGYLVTLTAAQNLVVEVDTDLASSL